MVDLQLKWTVGIGSGGLGHNLHSPTRTPLLIFDHQPPLWYKFISLSSLLLPLKSMMAAIIFVKKSLSTHLPKLHRFALEYIFLLHNETTFGWSMHHEANHHNSDVFSNCVFWLWRLSISTTAMPGRFSMT